MASPALSFSTHPWAEGQGAVAAREVDRLRKPGSSTKRSSACLSASPSSRHWQKPVPKKTWRRSAWRPTTRRTSLLRSRTLPRTGWRSCVTLRFRYLYSFHLTCVSVIMPTPLYHVLSLCLSKSFILSLSSLVFKCMSSHISHIQSLARLQLLLCTHTAT